MIAKSAAGVSVAVVLFSLTQLAKELVLAWQFGAGPQVNLLGLASAFHLVVFGILSTGIEAAYVPRHMESARDSRETALAMGRGILIAMTSIALLAAVATVPVALAMYPYWDLPGQGPSSRQDFLLLMIVLGFWTIFRVSFFSLRAILSAEKVFLAPAAARLLLNLGTIAGTVWLADRMGIHGVAVGMAVGAFLECAVLLPVLSREFLQRRSVDWASTKGVLVAMVPYTLALLLPNFNILIDRAFAAGLGAGSIAALGYAERILYLPVQAVILPVLLVLFPYISEAVVRGQTEKAERLTASTFVALGAIVVPMAVVLGIESHSVVAALFQRKSFTLEDTARTAALVSWYGAALPMLAASYILQRGLQAAQASRFLLVLSLVLFLSKILGNWLMVPFFGIGGIAMSFALMYAVYAASCAIGLKRRVGRILTRTGELDLLKLAVAGCVCAAALIGARWIPASWLGSSSELLGLVMRIVLAGLAYLAALWILRPRTIWDFWNRRSSAAAPS